MLALNAQGVPTPIGSPVSSGGIKPVSIAVSDDPLSFGLVYVANAGDATGGANYTGFRLGLGGTLTPVPNSTYTLPAGSDPSDVCSIPPAAASSAPT